MISQDYGDNLTFSGEPNWDLGNDEDVFILFFNSSQELLS